MSFKPLLGKNIYLLDLWIHILSYQLEGTIENLNYSEEQPAYTKVVTPVLFIYLYKGPL